MWGVQARKAHPTTEFPGTLLCIRGAFAFVCKNLPQLGSDSFTTAVQQKPVPQTTPTSALVQQGLFAWGA
jgi:hypothetical protein